MIRIERPATSTSTNQVAAKMTVCPRSGWPISSSAMTPVSAAASGTTGRLWSWSRSDSTQASDTAKKGFKNSDGRSEEHTSELQSLMRISYAVFCLKKKTQDKKKITRTQHKKRSKQIQ